MAVVIRNAKVVNADKTHKNDLDILLDKGKIVKIAANLKAGNAKEIDAKGLLVMPGLIDIHVHFREPGGEHKETIESGSRAAARGGFTTVMCMPNTRPVLDSAMMIDSVIKEARRVGLVNVVPIGAISRGQKDEELVDMFELKESGCLALSDDGKSVVNSQLMRRAIEYSKMAGLVLIQHCEDPLLSAGGAMNEGETSTRLGIKGDPGLSESVIVSRDIELANYLGGHVHFAHMSLKRCVDLIRFAKSQGIPVTAEACPHHFTLTEEAVSDFSTSAKMNPPLRTQKDVDAIKAGIKDGTIDCIVTDHAPHTKEDKEVDFEQAPFGIIGLETSVALTISELVKPGVISWNEMVERMSSAPARIMGMEGKGVIEEGADGDITLIDPERQWVFSEKEIASKSRNTPFLGRELTGKVVATICGGKLSYQEKN